MGETEFFLFWVSVAVVLRSVYRKWRKNVKRRESFEGYDFTHEFRKSEAINRGEWKLPDMPFEEGTFKILNKS